MESNKVSMTNEKLRQRFSTSQFDLVSYAIKLAENMIKSGRAPRIKSDKQNIAMIILDEITQGKDQFEPIPEKVETFAAPAESYSNKHQKFTELASSKHSEKKKEYSEKKKEYSEKKKEYSEKKKPRKILAD